MLWFRYQYSQNNNTAVILRTKYFCGIELRERSNVVRRKGKLFQSIEMQSMAVAYIKTNFGNGKNIFKDETPFFLEINFWKPRFLSNLVFCWTRTSFSFHNYSCCLATWGGIVPLNKPLVNSQIRHCLGRDASVPRTLKEEGLDKLFIQ